MICVIDNYDSFVHNLARYFREAGRATEIIRNDAAGVAEILASAPAAVVISPGPKAPDAAGVCLDLIANLPATTPLLGVCLGHQCLVEAFGGRTVRAATPVHGEASEIRHDGDGLFRGLPSPMRAGRYHSLVSELAPDCGLVATAHSAAGEVMAVRRRGAPWFGVQFHPESVLTPQGRALIDNFLLEVAGRAAA
ncbi:MAG: aminodeoxychorismate/anthranilate synthase component II [Parvularculaceae bacterium]|nr:aminodeoxychorismate/anthranilate synthase component II [Parvularculaceae bacterium]